MSGGAPGEAPRDHRGLKFAAVLEKSSAAILLAALAIVPWIKTPVKPRRVRQFELVLLAGVSLWALSCGIARRRPRVPGIAALVGFVIGYGLLMAVNAKGRFDFATGLIVPTSQPIAWLPGSIDRATSVATVAQLGAVLVAGLAMIDLARLPVFRRRLLWAMAASAALLGVLGAFDRFGIGPVRFPQVFQEGSHFATYAYHANAAAYLNLALPAALYLWVGPGRSRRERAGGGVVLGGILIGCATHVSKAGLVFTLATLGAFAVRLRSARKSDRERNPLAGARHSGFALGVVAILVAAAGFVGAAPRWRQLQGAGVADNARVLIWRTALMEWREQPISGTGPGTFKLLVAPTADEHVPGLRKRWIVQVPRRGEPDSIWMRAHNDALQTLAEWGVVGSTALAAIVLLPLARLMRQGVRFAPDPTFRLAALMALSAVLIHALVDFPLQILSIQLSVTGWAAAVLADRRAP